MTLSNRMAYSLYALITLFMFVFLPYVHTSVSVLFGWSFYWSYSHFIAAHPVYTFILSRVPMAITVLVLWWFFLTARQGPVAGDYRKNLWQMALIVGVIQTGSAFLSEPEPFTVNFLTGPFTEVVAKLLFTITIAPLTEEIVFRDILPEAFRKLLGSEAGLWLGIVISAAVFGWLHRSQYRWDTVAQIALLGLIFGIARVRSEGIFQPILLHMLASILAIASGLFVRLTS